MGISYKKALMQLYRNQPAAPIQVVTTPTVFYGVITKHSVSGIIEFSFGSPQVDTRIIEIIIIIIIRLLLLRISHNRYVHRPPPQHLHVLFVGLLLSLCGIQHKYFGGGWWRMAQQVLVGRHAVAIRTIFQKADQTWGFKFRFSADCRIRFSRSSPPIPCVPVLISLFIIDNLSLVYAK